jgi:recombinational DNA repair protein RecT
MHANVTLQENMYDIYNISSLLTSGCAARAAASALDAATLFVVMSVCIDSNISYAYSVAHKDHALLSLLYRSVMAKASC